MQSFVVNITDEVEDDIISAFNYIHEHSPQNAIDWLRGLHRAMDTLEKMPDRCSLIPEDDAFEQEVRNLVYHSHRILFTINHADSIVEVHAFRHGAQDDLKS